MLYVERDHLGEIVAVLREPTKPGMEEKLIVDKEILDFLGRHASQESVLHLLSSMDAGVVRILEDLIDLLIRKNFIMLTEFPEEAQRKLINRQRIRRQIGDESIIVDDIL